MKRQLLILLNLIFCCFYSNSQDYIAGIKGAQVWTSSELGSVLKYGIMIKNTPLVKNAVALSHAIVVVWNDKNGALIISYKYDY